MWEYINLCHLLWNMGESVSCSTSGPSWPTAWTRWGSRPTPPVAEGSDGTAGSDPPLQDLRGGDHGVILPRRRGDEGPPQARRFPSWHEVAQRMLRSHE